MHKKYNWDQVDWSKSDAEIMKEIGAPRSTVSAQRSKRKKNAKTYNRMGFGDKFAVAAWLKANQPDIHPSETLDDICQRLENARANETLVVSFDTPFSEFRAAIRSTIHELGLDLATSRGGSNPALVRRVEDLEARLQALEDLVTRQTP